MDPEWVKWWAGRSAANTVNHDHLYAVFRNNNIRVPQTPMNPNIWDTLLTSCPFMVFAAGVGGYVIGMGIAFMLGAMEQAEVDSRLRYQTQISQVYKPTWAKMKSQGKSFASFGAVYMAFECPLEKFRGSHDAYNAMFAGIFTGSSLALVGRSTIKGAGIAGLSCGAFCYVIELVLNRH